MKDGIKKFVQLIKDQGLYPDTPIIEGPSTDPEVQIDGKKYLIFCSNNYLGLANKDFLKDAAIEYIKKYGVGPAGARLMAGNLDVYNLLEEEIADFLGKEDAMIFSTGYAANLGAIKALVDPLMEDQPFKKGSSVIFSDELNHTSIIQGCKLSSAERIIYKHNDIYDLEQKIKTFPTGKRKLIITDGVFSMDGDIVPLGEIVSVAKKYSASVMVDDAHGIGVLGKTGKGTEEYFNLSNNDVDIIIMGTLVKAFGTMGGFIAGAKDMIEYLKISAKTYIFSVPMSPVMAGASIEAIKYVKTHPKLIQCLISNANYLRSELKKIGYNTLSSQTPIIPVLLGSEQLAIDFAKDLFENGIYIPAIRWPAVDRDKSRIRISVMAHHTKEHLDRLLEIMEDLRKKYFK